MKNKFKEWDLKDFKSWTRFEELVDKLPRFKITYSPRDISAKNQNSLLSQGTIEVVHSRIYPNNFRINTSAVFTLYKNFPFGSAEHFVRTELKMIGRHYLGLQPFGERRP